MTRMEVGLMDPVMVAKGRADAITRGSYMGAVLTGADSYWVPDHINGQTPRPLWDPKYMLSSRLFRSPDAPMDAWMLLSSLATRRRLNRIRLGIGVTDTGKRHPAVTAQSAATLNLMTRGKAILGIGPGERVGNEPYGVEWSKPVARFEESLATIRALWESKGELVNRDSQFFPLRNAIFDIPAYQGKWPEIWVAAHGPRMLRATGRYGDAWFPGFAHLPADYASRLEVIRSAASDAGRDPMSITPAFWMPVMVGTDRDSVDATLNSVAVRAWALNGSSDFFAHFGAEHPMGVGFAGMQDHVAFTLDEPTILEKASRVPLEVVKNMLLHGTVDDVLDQAAVWRDHGVRHIVVVNFGPMGPSARSGLASMGPFNKVVRGIKRL